MANLKKTVLAMLDSRGSHAGPGASCQLQGLMASSQKHWADWHQDWWQLQQFSGVSFLGDPPGLQEGSHEKARALTTSRHPVIQLPGLISIEPSSGAQ